MSHLFSVAAGLAVLGLTMTVRADGPSRLVTRLDAGRPQTVVTYGTSLTAGGAWVGQMTGALNARYPGLVTVINSGKGSMWSKWGVDHLEERVIARKPDTVFIEFAINDAFLNYQTSPAQARTNLVAMIDRILAARADTEIILMTMNPAIGRHRENRPQLDAYYQMYREVAKERNLRLIDHHANWSPMLARDAALFSRYVPDGIHPNAEGCAKVITPAILEALGLPAAPKPADAAAKK